MTLLLSIASLLLGPIIYMTGHKNPTARRILDGVIILTIAVIIIVHIIPEALRHTGWLAALIITLGLIFPIILERLFHKAANTAHLFIIGLAIVGLLIHAVIDGVALLSENEIALTYAIVLHRLPVGITIWCIARPNFGLPVTTALFALVILSTVAGFFIGPLLLNLAETQTLDLLQAFISGSLVHAIIFRHGHKH